MAVRSTEARCDWAEHTSLRTVALAFACLGLLPTRRGARRVALALAVVCCAQQVAARAIIFRSLVDGDDSDGQVASSRYSMKMVCTSLLAFLALLAHRCASVFFTQGHLQMLVDFADARNFLLTWQKYLRGYLVACLPLVAATGASTGFDLLADAREAGLPETGLFTPWLVYTCAAFSNLWIVVLVCIGHMLLSAAELAQDAYVVWLTHAVTPDRVFAKYNALSAVTRTISEVISYPLVVIFPALPCMIFLQLIGNINHGVNFDYAQAMHLAGSFSIVWYAKNVTRSAELIPLIVQQINFGKEIDIDRWCICAAMKNDLAAIRLFGGLEINTIFFAKIVWVCGSIGVVTLSSPAIRNAFS